MNFAKRLATLRKEAGLTQKELADKLGVSRGTIGMYEIGQRDPDTETLQKLSDIFGVSVDYLLGKTDIRNPSDEITEAVEDDPDLRIIERARQKMSPKDRERMMKILKASFEDFFNEDEEEDENE